MEEGKATKPSRNIDLRHADLVFLVCYFVSGLLDSSAYNAWTCFVSMQTGKTAAAFDMLVSFRKRGAF